MHELKFNVAYLKQLWLRHLVFAIPVASQLVEGLATQLLWDTLNQLPGKLYIANLYIGEGKYMRGVMPAGG